MPSKDPYEDLCKYYEFMLGPLPMKDHLLRAIRETVTPDELAVFFLLPFGGHLVEDKLVKKARKAGIPSEVLEAALARLPAEGFILAYDTPQGRAYERGNPGFMTEQQVRKQEDTPRRTAYAQFFNYIIEGATAQVPNKTPYYRTVPVESALPGPTRTIPVGEPVADPRGPLPLDVISAVVKEQSLIGVAECYCRKAKQVVGEACGHPLETCLVFNELAQTLIESGIARRLDYEETMQILWDAEEAGLVHNVDNCEGPFRSVCNCCGCSCVIMKVIQRGQTNASAPSRYIVAHDAGLCAQCESCVAVCPVGAATAHDGRVTFQADLCIGCGLCVSRCQEGAVRMVLRERPPKVYPSYDKLTGKIVREAIIGIGLNRILGRG
jgi:Fe-S-cluster-containing hydrogenase component 2